MASPLPRVTLPGIDADPRVREMIEEYDRNERHVRKEKRGLAEAMLRLNKPIFRKARTSRKARKTTPHVRRMRAHAARAAYLRGDA